MNRKLVTGSLAGVAALALAIGGGTYSAPQGSADIAPNIVRGGALMLDLGADGAGTTLSFQDLLPGGTSRQLIWVATNDRSSTTPASIALTFRNLRDHAAACNVSIDKAQAEIAAGIPGCTITSAGATGTPAQGNLSRLLAFDVTYATAATCTSAPSTNSLLPDGPGNLRASATAHGTAGTTYRLTEPGTSGLLRLLPSQGVCVAVTAHWPVGRTTAAPASPQHPHDNAAQDDSFTVDVRFDLTQVPG